MLGRFRSIDGRFAQFSATIRTKVHVLGEFRPTVGAVIEIHRWFSNQRVKKTLDITLPAGESPHNGWSTGERTQFAKEFLILTNASQAKPAASADYSVPVDPQIAAVEIAREKEQKTATYPSNSICVTDVIRSSPNSSSITASGAGSSTL